MRYHILIAVLLLGGCAKTVVPVQVRPVAVPALPPTLDVDPKPLPPIKGTTIGDVLMDSVTSTRAYNGLREDYIALRRTYNCVKSSGLNSEELKKCMQ